MAAALLTPNGKCRQICFNGQYNGCYAVPLIYATKHKYLFHSIYVFNDILYRMQQKVVLTAPNVYIHIQLSRNRHLSSYEHLYLKEYAS